MGNLFTKIETHWKGVLAVSSLMLALLATAASVLSYLEVVIENKAKEAVDIRQVKEMEDMNSRMSTIESLEAKHFKEQSSLLRALIEKQKRMEAIHLTTNSDINIHLRLGARMTNAQLMLNAWGYRTDLLRYATYESVGVMPKYDYTKRFDSVAVMLQEDMPETQAITLLNHLVNGAGLPVTHINTVDWLNAKTARGYRYTVEVFPIERANKKYDFNRVTSEQLERILSGFNMLNGDSYYTRFVRPLTKKAKTTIQPITKSLRVLESADG